MVYAVIDTNVIISSFISRNPESSTRRVVISMIEGLIRPLYNDDILREYSEVLRRPKFKLAEKDVDVFIDFIRREGIDSSRMAYDGHLPDEDDRVFYEVALSDADAYLVTGNLKRFPCVPKVVTAAQMMDILEGN